MALDLTSPFVWGAGGSRLTPEEIAAQRKVADSLLASGMDYSPIKSPWQGAARVAQAVLGGLESGEAGAASKANAAESGKLIAALLGGGAAPAAATDAASAPIATGAAVPAGNTTIPAGSIDPALSGAISAAASSNGVDPAYMTRLALVENGGKINGSSPLSSATGPFQFLNSTAKQYGLTNPSDPAAAADAAARLTLDNKAALTQALGREPTLGELYLAHQQGAGGAAKLLANPDAPVEQVIGHTAAANNGASPGMTAGQFASKWTNKFADLGQPQVVDANQSSPLDTAQYPAGPVGSPTAIAGNAGGVPPVMTGDQSSPLDTAMYPAGPVGAPMMAASGGAPQAADGVDPAVLPVNAQPAQGTLPTAQAVQAATAPAPSAKPAINPAILQAMTSPYVDQQTKAIATMLFKSQMDQQAKANDPMRALDMQTKQLAIKKAQQDLEKPDETFGVIGQDPNTGKSQYGFINTKTGTARPYNIPQTGNSPQGSIQEAMKAGVKGDDLYQFMPPDRAQTVKAMVEGRMPPPSTTAMRSPATMQLIDAANAIDPSFDATTWKARSTFNTQFGSQAPSSIGGQKVLMGTALGHLGEVAESAAKLGNTDGLGIAKAGHFANYVKNQTTGQAAIANALEDKVAKFSGEVGKLYSGSQGGGVHEREDTRNRLGSSLTSAELAAGLESSRDLILSKQKALEDQASTIFGPEGAKKFDFIGPEGRDAIKKIDAAIMKMRGQNPDAASPTSVQGQRKTSSGISWSIE